MALIFAFLFGCIVVSLLFPEFNPDLFWHLAAARKAEQMGRFFLSTELFSFTKQGAHWINYEWLFEWISWRLHQWGDFRALVIARAFLVTAGVAGADFYLVRRLALEKTGLKNWAIRTANIVMVYAFLATRATMQPELFTLLFLIIFFYLRDELMSRHSRESGNPEHPGMYGLDSRFRGNDGIQIGVYVLLFILWANIHGGFVWPLGILGLQFLSAGVAMLNAWVSWRFYRKLDQEQWGAEAGTLSRRMTVLIALGLLGAAATLVNPYGIDLYKVIIQHLQDTPFISTVIMEWQPTRFDQAGTWRYWGVFAFAITILLTNWLMTRKFNFEGTFIVLVFGIFAGKHIRNIALFGLISLPIVWQAALQLLSHFPAWRDLRFREAGRVFALILMMAGALGSAQFLFAQAWTAGRNLWRYRGIPRAFLSAGNYPEFACQFLERNPKLMSLKIWTEWGWGGFAIWRLHDAGARFFFDGRYVFHDELHELMHRAEDPLEWGKYLIYRGVELAMVKHPEPEEFQPARISKPSGDGYEPIIRSWRSWAYPASDWALIWWDHTSLVFLRRDSWPKDVLHSLEYKSRLPVDPQWVEWQVKRGRLKPEDLLAELGRNGREAGWNPRNRALYAIVSGWKEGKF